MVGLVIVSHSRNLAAALVGLLKQVVTAEIPLAIAAGAGEDRSAFGTDAVEIMQAVESVFSEDGVVILMDLGSAVLSAEMAVELLPPEYAGKIRICPAPLVEGSLSAGVQIGLGSDLETVCREALQSLAPKIEHISGEQGAPAPAETASPPLADGQAQAVTLTLKNEHGLHARPAARFVQTANQYNAKIQVTNLTTGKGPVPAASLNAIATLGALHDHQIQVSASGPQAEQVLEALRQLVADNFGEQTGQSAPKPVPQAAARVKQEAAADLAEAGAENTWQAVPVSDGVALGPFYYYQPALPPIPQDKAQNIQQEKQRLDSALEQTRKVIEKRHQDLKGSLGEEQAAIFEAHMLILQDPDLRERVHQRIAAQQENAALAWSTVINQVAETYRSLPDPYQQQRAVDVMDIGGQVLFGLAGQGDPGQIVFQEPVILFAEEITPTETARLDLSSVLGILTVGGGPTSHSAILARSAGIPAVSGVPPALKRLPSGTLLAMDGFNGKIQVEPPAEVQQAVKAQREAWLAQRQRLIETSQQAAATRDGRRVEVFANVGNVNDGRAAVQNGAEGIGLLRTEFLYLTHATPPTEDEQVQALREIAAVMDGRAVTIRTLDVGGDKNLPYVDLPEEANPFLGVRAIRMAFQHPELFMTQLRAILRAGTMGGFRVMFPMIANLEEFRQARAMVEKAHHALQAAQVPHAWPIELGIMVEIPSAALLSQAFAREVDFFSIGTNDLTQYTLAAERGNPMLSGLSDALHPAVLRLMKEVAQAAHEAGKWAGVCGELAGDPQAAAILVGLGIDELSMNAGSIPLIKSVLRQVDLAEASALAGEALRQTCAEDVRSLAQAFIKKKEGLGSEA